MTKDLILWHDRKRTFLGLPWSFTKYDLAEERLFVTTGFFTTVENEIRLFRILDVKLTRTLYQKIFGLGTITVTSSDKTMGTFELKNIKNSDRVKEMLSEQVDKVRTAKHIGAREIMMGDDEIMDDDFTGDGV